MALEDLTQEDFSFWVKYSEKMRNCHEKEFLRVIDPDLIRAYYRGLNKKTDQIWSSQYENYEPNREHTLTLSRMFQASNTILPNLYYQNPSPIITPIRGAKERHAAMLTAAIKHYMKLNSAKRQNQEAVMNAWFFGLGWKKIGYQAVFKNTPLEQSAEGQKPNGLMQNMMSMLGMGQKPTNLDPGTTRDYLDYDHIFNFSESPLNVMVDYKTDLWNSRCILHRLPKTLYDLKSSGYYDSKYIQDLEDKMRYQNGTMYSDREIDVHLNELHILQRDGTYVLSWCDELQRAARYELSSYQGKGFQFEPLVFTNEPGVRYPISHMKVASHVQEHIDYMATLAVKIIDRMRNQILVDKNALAPGQDKALQQNELGGIIFTNRPITQGVFAQMTSAAVSGDIGAMLQVVQQNITEILGADNQLISGKSSNETLGQDELARVGTKIRESGMLDKVRDFMINQFQKEGTLIKQFQSSELMITVSPKDYVNPETGRNIKEEFVEFGTPEQPLPLSQILEGDFDYDINIYEAIKPDKQSLQVQYEKMIMTSANPVVKQALLESGKRFRTDYAYEQWLNTFDGVGNPNSFLETLDSMQVAAIQTKDMMMQGKVGMPQVVKVPKEGEAPQASETSNPSSEAQNL